MLEIQFWNIKMYGGLAQHVHQKPVMPDPDPASNKAVIPAQAGVQ